MYGFDQYGDFRKEATFGDIVYPLRPSLAVVMDDTKDAYKAACTNTIAKGFTHEIYSLFSTSKSKTNYN